MSVEKQAKRAPGKREWLLTDGLGGYALGCCDAKPRRRYHSFCTVASFPPIRRINVLGGIRETIVVGEIQIALFENNEKIRLECNADVAAGQWVKWTQQVATDGIVFDVEKKLSLVEGGGAHVEYKIVCKNSVSFALVLRPLLLQRSHHRTLGVEDAATGPEAPVQVSGHMWELKTALLNCDKLLFQIEGGDVSMRQSRLTTLSVYDFEKERGYEYQEEVSSDFDVVIDMPAKKENIATFAVTLLGHSAEKKERMIPIQIQESPNIKFAADMVLKTDKDLWQFARELSLHADDFIVKNHLNHNVVAGYPWFGIWARDTFIGLPGLCLVRQNFEAAKSILQFFAGHIENGLVPNYLYMTPDRAALARDYASADATPWFLYAAARYSEVAQDRHFVCTISSKIDEIVECHERGASYNVRIDSSDGLLYAGCHGVPLTWMHAHIGNHCFTPRIGKPIEINAVWISALYKWARLLKAVHMQSSAEKLLRLAEKANSSFDKFWCEQYGWFADVLDSPNHSGYAWDLSLRPNQVIALGLPEIKIDAKKRKRALLAVSENLLVDTGLRGISCKDSRYSPVYSGSPDARDAVYHNGPAWPWLIGFYISAQKLANGEQSRSHRREVLKALRHFYGRDTFGHFAEIYDSEHPYTARGCPAQALSLAEPLRALVEDFFDLETLPANDFGIQGFR